VQHNARARPSVHFIFSFYIGLLAHYSFSPSDKRSAHIKRLLLDGGGVFCRICYWWISSTSRPMCSIRECFQTLYGYTLVYAGIYGYTLYTCINIYVCVFLCVCVPVCMCGSHLMNPWREAVDLCESCKSKLYIHTYRSIIILFHRLKNEYIAIP